ncbi:MAG TPA: NAD(+) diphosphatase [Streptosporangiaceae bacterium]
MTGLGDLGRLALSRGTVDRATERRSDPAWLAAAWADPTTRVLVVDGGRALVRFSEGQAELVFVPPAQAPAGVRFLLGVEAGRMVYFGVAAALDTIAAAVAGDGAGPADGATMRPASLREVGALLGDRDAGLMTHAVALANWHESHTHCPRDGTPTTVDAGGHSTTCPADGTQHFPRTDPAVIMLVTDPDDRCLLARNKAWPEGRVSILAGFVDPGESAEQAVVREVHEETGITVDQVRYLGSQPWPLPRSLMLGFRSSATGDLRIRVDAEEIAEARWFTRDELRQAVETQEIGLPPAVSIARRIIEAWYGAELPSGSRFG